MVCAESGTTIRDSPTAALASSLGFFQNELIFKYLPAAVHSAPATVRAPNPATPVRQKLRMKITEMITFHATIKIAGAYMLSRTSKSMPSRPHHIDHAYERSRVHRDTRAFPVFLLWTPYRQKNLLSVEINNTQVKNHPTAKSFQNTGPVC